MTFSETHPLPKMKRPLTQQDKWTADDDPRSSAVLMLFIPPKKGSTITQIVFTRRSNSVRTHKSQIGFPGGRREQSDSGPFNTALREAEEEISLLPERVHIIGSLPSLAALDRKLVVPIVAYSDLDLAELKANPHEVDEIFALPWTLFQANECQNLRFNIFSHWRESPYFEAEGYHIWGLTAWILSSACFA